MITCLEYEIEDLKKTRIKNRNRDKKYILSKRI